MLKVKNETAESADIYIYGTIIDDEDAAWIKFWNEDQDGYQFPQELRRQLEGLSDKNLTLYINSYGGSIPAGVAMANMIKRHRGKTTAIVDGYCCSIATQIFFSADKCKMSANSWLMIHKPFSGLIGNADEMRKAAETLDTLQRGLEIVYRQKAQEKVSAEEIHSLVEKETWLTGTEAAEKFKIEVTDAAKMLNCVGNMEKLKKIAKKIPQSLNFISESEVTPKENFDWAEIEIAMARAKGAVLDC